MCGIAGGIWNSPAGALSADDLARMTSALAHRGPDGQGTYTSELRVNPPYGSRPGVALGHRRLAILDVDHGQQPLGNETGSIQLVFNGEIYNYIELRHRLEATGHIFRTATDSEVIVHLYEDLGTDCFQHLNGMFALAMWDEPRRQLVLARDRLGKKPLVYHANDERLLFASEIKSLLTVMRPAGVDLAALDAYLTYQYVPHPRTIYRDIHKLPPAHWASWRDGQWNTRCYWQPQWESESSLSVLEATEQLRTLLRDAVRLRLRSDVPWGVFLSGGVDSSLMAALAREMSSQPPRTFCLGFDIPEYDERPYARAVARQLGSMHDERVISPRAVDLLPRLVSAYDEPFADSSAIPTWYLSQLAREHVTMVLGGDGGDELFLGYARYWATACAEQVGQMGWLKQLLSSPAWQWLPSSSRQKSRLRQFKRFSEALALTPARRYADWISIFNEWRRVELYTDEFLAALPAHDPFEFLHQAWNRGGRRSDISRAAIADLQTYLPGDLLAKVDIASMAHGLEVRAPMLDYRVVELASRLPAHFHMRWGRGKRMLRDAFSSLLPNSVWNRRKMGFGVPLDHWFRGELRNKVRELTSPTTPLIASGWFQSAAINQLVREHDERQFDHSARLWSLLVLNEWFGQRKLDQTSS